MPYWYWITRNLIFTTISFNTSAIIFEIDASALNSKTCEYYELKGKAIPLQAWPAPEVYRMLRLPDFSNRHMKVVRLSALRIGRLYHQEIFLVLISVRGWVKPQGHSAAGGIMTMKNSNDTIGNRTRNLTVCSAVPQPTALPRAPGRNM